ncbi:MBL fold metallo-hydrolase [Archaeoglobales archaeon]|nr:MAG: MBL fold metallo-hydrolase [Archaeoglobales archaeon]
MKYRYAALTAILIGIVLFLFARQETKVSPLEKIGESSSLRLIIIYDNYQFRKDLPTGWGFSCVVISNKTLLFDTGGDGRLLLHNLKSIGLDPKDVDYVFLSHIHHDHTGGLFDFLECNSNVTVFLPKSFPWKFKDEVKRTGARIVEVSGPEKLVENFYSTGEMGFWIKEQSLIISTERGLVVITGCAHPGIVSIVKRAKELTNKEILLVLGGFHLIGKDESELRRIALEFKEMGVKHVAPCHCSGDLARKIFREEFGDSFIEVGVGKIIDLSEL